MEILSDIAGFGLAISIMQWFCIFAITSIFGKPGDPFITSFKEAVLWTIPLYMTIIGIVGMIRGKN